MRLIAASLAILLTPPSALAATEAQAREAISASKPIVDRMIEVGEAQTLRLTIGVMREATFGIPNTPVPKDAALLEHADRAFSNFSDESVPLKVRITEFMRQDQVRMLAPMRRYGESVSKCLGAPLVTAAQMADPDARKRRLEGIECARESSTREMQSWLSTAATTQGLLILLKLPTSAEEFLGRYFNGRDRDDRQQVASTLRNINAGLDAARNVLKFLEDHPKDFHLAGDTLEFSNEEALAEFQALQEQVNKNMKSDSLNLPSS
jgi:hypothetical protein